MLERELDPGPQRVIDGRRLADAARVRDQRIGVHPEPVLPEAPVGVVEVAGLRVDVEAVERWHLELEIGVVDEVLTPIA